MLEGLWTLEINSALENFTTGIAVLRGGRILGGDTRYFYVGRYNIDSAGMVEARVTFTHYAGSRMSVVGLAQQLAIVLSGETKEDTFDLSGSIEGVPGSMLSIRLTRRAEL